MTHLNAGFFWHQFKAGSWWFQGVNALGALALFGGVTTSWWGGPWYFAIMAGLGLITLAQALIPESAAYRALGMNWSRTLQQMLFVYAPLMLISVVVAFAVNPVGVALIASASVVGAGAIMIYSARPVGDDAGRGSTGRSRRLGTQGGFTWQLIWRPVLVAAAVTGVATGIAGVITAGMTQDGVRTIIVSFPLLAFWIWFGQSVVMDRLSPRLYQSFGKARKSWATNIVAAAAVGSALIPATVNLITGVMTGFQTLPALELLTLVALVTFGVCVSAAGIAHNAYWLTFLFTFVVWHALRDVMNEFDSDPSLLWFLGIVTGAMTVIGVVLIVLFLAGRLNVNKVKFGQNAFAS